MSKEKNIIGFVLTTSIIFNSDDKRSHKEIVTELEDKVLDLIEELGHDVLVGKGKPILKSEVD